MVAVDDVGFEAGDREITGLLGPNGAGKTTTLRMLYSLMAPESGRVLVDGRDVATDPVAARRALGVLPDALGVYQRLTARENIQHFAQLHRLPRAIVDARSVTLAAALHTAAFLDRQTARLSHGQPHNTTTPPAPALPHQP